MSAKSKHYSDLFEDMHQYMFSTDNMSRFVCNDNSSHGSNKAIKTHLANKQMNKQHVDTIYYPRQHDSLFWCFYIVLFGFEAYEFGRNNTFKTEKDFKINSVELLRANKDKIKAFKLKLADVENELVNEQKISLTGLSALCLIYNVTIFSVFDSTYYEFINEGPSPKSGIIVMSENNKYGVRQENIEQYMVNVRASRWLITNPNKPIKAIGSYTLSELKDISEKLKLPTIDPSGKKKNKTELYQAIVSIVC